MNKPHRKPPRLAQWLLGMLTDYRDLYSISGDLEEVYHEIGEEKGYTAAYIWYWIQCLGAVPKFTAYKAKWTFVMMGSAVRAALRNMLRQKGYSFINLFGLAVGMASSILIALWIQDELSFDRFHENNDRLFKGVTVFPNGTEIGNSSWKLGPELMVKYPEIETFSRVWPWHRSLIRADDKSFMEEQFYLVDSDFFTMFSFPFVYGDPSTALSDLNSVVISERTAHRFFGDTNPVGKTLFVVRDNRDYTVTGVFKNVPQKSSLQFDVAARVEIMPAHRFANWYYVGYSYFMLRQGVDYKAFNKKIENFFREVVDQDATGSPYMQPFSDVYLQTVSGKGRITQVYLFAGIAIIIILIACINYMNLSIARSARRAREVGLRKVCGAYRSQVMKQFIGESFVVTLISLFIALILTAVSLPVFNNLTGRSLNLLSILSVKGFMVIASFIVAVGLAAGSYPALYLSRFSPVQVMKNNAFSSSGRSKFRNTLIVIQFLASVILMICTITVYRQIKFINETDTGFDRDMVIVMRMPDDDKFRSRYDAFRQAVENDPRVLHITGSMGRPVDLGYAVTFRRENAPDEDLTSTRYTVVDYDFTKTFGIELTQGRAFSLDISADETNSCILNETACRLLGLESPVGEEIYFQHLDMPDSFRHVKVIGVVRDFNFQSLHSEIRPLLLRIHRPWLTYMFIKISPGDSKGALTHVKNVFSQFAPEYPFDYEFLDDIYLEMYASEQQARWLFNAFSLLAVVISCLGILGLASYAAERRTKEIGIRKTLGASESMLVLLLTREFAFLVIIANCIALPAGYFLMEYWLREFAYRIGIGWSVFIVSFSVSLLIALFTVSFQAVKAARANPVDSLRYE